MMNGPSLIPRPGRAILLVLASALLISGCSAAASPAAPTPAGGASPAAASGAPGGRPSDLPVRTPNLATVPPTAPPVVGEAPPAILAAARADLVARTTAVAAAGATVIRSEAVAWPDGSLGCRVIGELYPQVITPGYWIVFTVDGKEYDYRATEAGFVRLCEHTLKPNPGG